MIHDKLKAEIANVLRQDLEEFNGSYWSWVAVVGDDPPENLLTLLDQVGVDEQDELTDFLNESIRSLEPK